MEFDLVIRNGTVITSTKTYVTDIAVHNGKIVIKGKNLSAKNIVDAEGLYVLPGATDPHVHLEMPTRVATSSDDWFTGTRSAACGGTTTVIDFVELSAEETLLQALESRRTLAESKAVIDFSLHMTLDRVDYRTLAEIPKVVDMPPLFVPLSMLVQLTEIG